MRFSFPLSRLGVLLLLANLMTTLLGAQIYPGPPAVHHGDRTISLLQLGGASNLQVYDFSGNGSTQLLLFDRDGDHLDFLRWNDSAWEHHSNLHTYANPEVPPWEADPPGFRHWVFVAEGNCDQEKLIFTASGESFIRILKARPASDFGYQSLTELYDTLRYWDGTAMQPLFVNRIDIPGVADVDGDGDLDILTFAPLGGALQFFRNESGACDVFEMVLADDCWGKFYETGITKAVLLDTCPPGLRPGSNAPGMHTGSTVLPFDYDGNGLMDLALGDLSFDNINLLYNHGSLQSAHIAAQDTAFPPTASPVNIPQFPAAFLLDADRDGASDLLAAPNSENTHLDVDNLWLYENRDTAGGYDFALKQKNFLTEWTMDWGSYSGVARLNDTLIAVSIGQSRSEEGEGPGRIFLYKSHPVYQRWELIDSNYGDIARYGLKGIAVDFDDLNGDEIPDMVLGDESGKLFYAYLTAGYQRPGSTITLEPFDPPIDVGSNACPTLGYVDGDSLLDLLVGERNGNVNYFKNHGTPAVPSFNALPDDDFFGEIDTREPGQITGYSAPFLGKDPQFRRDLLMGARNGQLRHYRIRNSGTSVEVVEGGWSREPDWSRIDVGGFSRPAFIYGMIADVDILPLFVGNSRGGIQGYRIQTFTGMESRSRKLPLSLYPNPAGATLQIRAPEGRYLLQLFAPDGRLLRQMQVVISGNYNLNISHLPAGPYLLTLRGSASSGRQLFIKK